MPSRVVAFVQRFVTGAAAPPAPPPFDKNVPGAFMFFMDEDEKTILYQQSWPYLGCPVDDRTNSTTWLIGGQYYAPSRRDEKGNWIFRRCVG